MAPHRLTPYRPGAGMLSSDPLTSLHRELNRMFDDVYRGGLPTQGAAPGSDHLLTAHMNVSETDAEFRITAELPGVHEDDIDIRLDNDLLTIRGEKKYARTEHDEQENHHLVERAYGTFQRSLRLPTHVDAERVSATCENGVLQITLPKTGDQERSRRIQVQGRSKEKRSFDADQKKGTGDGSQRKKADAGSQEAKKS